jgi:uncharacterized protein (DUF433 family)
MAASAWTVAVLTTGGAAVSLAGVRLVSRGWARPAVAAAALIAAGYAVFGRRFDDEFETIARGATRAAPIVAVAAAAGAVAAAMLLGTFAAAGADASGYVSQAALWRDGRLIADQPFVARVRWPNADAAFAPLGYDAAPEGHAIVPAYPPGLPLLMAAAQIVGGACAAYIVVPLAAGAAVWFCYLLGRRARSPAAGAMAALLLAGSPVFVYQSLVPMSDVPAAACWAAALAFVASRPSHRNDLAGSAAAGCCAALALFIRPNLVLLALAVAAFAMQREDAADRWPARLIAFAAPLAAAGAAFGWMNLHRYGSPLRSGYGNMRTAFAASHVAPNIAHWTGWLTATETPLIVFAAVGVAAAFVAPAGPLSRRSAALIAATTLAVTLSYVGYAPFDEWSYLRFLLPAFPPLLVAMAAALLWMRTRLPAAVGVTAVLVLVVGMAGHGVRYLTAAGVGSLRDDARRYVAVARFATEQTPANAVYISLQHSGSLRYYSGRPVIRFDRISVDLDRALADLRQAGWRPYVVLEDWEETQFKQQFAAASQTGRLAGRPIARLMKYGVNVYDPQAGTRGGPSEIPLSTDMRCIDR